MTKQVKIFLFIAVIAVIFGGVAVWLQTANVPKYDNTDSTRPFLGQENAKVVLQEYSDFQCPACKSAVPVIKSLMQKYGDRVKFEYHYFPLTRIHSRAFIAAQAAECANDQGKFWEYHDLLFANQPNFSKSELKKYAADLDLDQANFSACLDSGAKKDIVNQDLNQAIKLKLGGTPSFILNGQPVADWSKLDTEIEKVLAE